MHPLQRGAASLLLLVALSCLGRAPAPANAQEVADASLTHSLDQRLLISIYEIHPPGVRGAAEVLDRTAYPVFLLTPTAVWAGAWMAGGGDYSAAHQLSASAALTFVAVKGAKAVWHRERPFLSVPGIQARVDRAEGYRADSFPSGHAAMAFTLATSLVQAYPGWAVGVTAYTWASTMAFSRVWLGVHYPSDVVAGALTGAAIAVLVRHVGGAVSPRLFIAPVEGGTKLGLQISLP